MSAPTENPYQSPVAACDGSPSSLGSLSVDWKAILRRWELLRIAYNGIVGLAGMVGLMMISSSMWPALVLDVVAYGLLANLMYLLGPAAELYLNWFVDSWAPRFVPRTIAQFVRSRYLTVLLFVVGAMFSVGLTLVVGLAMAFSAAIPNQP